MGNSGVGRFPGGIEIPRRPGGIGGTPSAGVPRTPGSQGRPGDLPGLGGLGSLTKSPGTRASSPTYTVDRQQLANQAAQVRNNIGNSNYFSRSDSLNSNRGSRESGNWRAERWAWGALGYATLADYYRHAAYSGYSGTPYYYDYGSNAAYSGDSAYVNGENAGTQEQYAKQAQSIADTGRQAQTSAEEDWLPLGVYAMVQGDQVNSNDIFQLGINKSGVIRGNYYNALTDTTQTVYGSVDEKSQRAAWTVGDKKEPVFEAGIANLTKSETTMLVHFDKDRTQQWSLVRINQSAYRK